MMKGSAFVIDSICLVFNIFHQSFQIDREIDTSFIRLMCTDWLPKWDVLSFLRCCLAFAKNGFVFLSRIITHLRGSRWSIDLFSFVNPVFGSISHHQQMEFFALYMLKMQKRMQPFGFIIIIFFYTSFSMWLVSNNCFSFPAYWVVSLIE